MPPTTYPTSSHLRVGVLLAPPPVQLLDLAPVDLFHMLSKEYLGVMPMLPQPVKNVAIHKIEIYFIADVDDPNVTAFYDINAVPTSTSINSDTEEAKKAPFLAHNKRHLAPLTANMNVELTATLSSPEAQPGQLSILIIPGPDPASVLSKTCINFIQSHAYCGSTDIITVCTGIFPACYSGICDGRVVTGPRGLLPELRGKFKGVKAFEDKRWSRSELSASKTSVNGSKGVTDPQVAGSERKAELWNAAGITNGHDCIAAYIKAHFNQELADIVCRIADVGERPRDYDTGQVAEGVWWISRILKAAVKGLFRK